MTGRAWPIDAVPAGTGDPEYTARHTRQTQMAPLAGGATAARPLGARSGVRPGTPAAAVEVTSTTWTVHQVAGLIDTESATEAGPYGFAFDTDQTGAVTAAHGSWPRWDALYVVLDDPAEDESETPSVRIEYRAGTAALSPALPSGASIPDRSFRLCKLVVPQSGGGSPSVVWDPPYAVAAGGTIPVSSSAELTALSAAATTDAPIYATLSSVLYVLTGAGLIKRVDPFAPVTATFNTSPSAVADNTSLATLTIPAAPVASKVHVQVTGQGGFVVAERKLRVLLSSNAGTLTASPSDFVAAPASRFASVVASGVLELPANTAATITIRSDSDGDSWFMGGAIATRWVD